MKQSITLFYFFLAIVALQTSCSEDSDPMSDPVTIEGCTQINACNYSPNANQDDGSCYFCSDCSGNTLESSDLEQTVDINLFDLNPASPRYNQVFSVLTIDWKRDTYCHNIENNFFIKFKNVTDQTITFDYYIESNANGNLRTAQGVVQNLPPNETFEKFEGESAFWNLKTYPINVVVINVNYN